MTSYTATESATTKYGEGIDRRITSDDLARVQTELAETFEGVTLTERRGRDGMEIVDQSGDVIYSEA